MKKHLFSLMMAFALVVGLSASAWAQTTPASITTLATGSPGNPKVYITGATDSVSILRGVANSNVSWVLFKGTSNTDPQADYGDDLDNVAHPSGWGPTQVSTSGAAGDPTYFHFKWTDQASGDYYLEVTETDTRVQASPAQDRNCALTVRGFHIWIMGFDVSIYASSATGDSLLPNALSGCSGSLPEYTAFMNNVSLTNDGTAIRTDIFNSSPLSAPIGTDLKEIIGLPTTSRVARYYTAVLHFDGAPAGVTAANYSDPAVASVRMDIKINVPPVNGDDSLYVHSIDGNLNSAHAYSARLTNEPVNATTGKTYHYTFPVEFNDVWGDDLTPSATVTNVTLYSAIDGGGLNLGEEPVKYEDIVPVPGWDNTDANRYDNKSNAFTIFGRPATSPITAP